MYRALSSTSLGTFSSCSAGLQPVNTLPLLQGITHPGVPEGGGSKCSGSFA